VTIRVVVADDQGMVRSGRSILLNAQPDIEVVGEAVNGQEAIARVAELRPDVILMDVRMPVMDGLQATRQIAAGDGAPRVLVLTTFDLDDYVYEALRSGASGFLLKDASAGELAAAVRVVAAGDAGSGTSGRRPRRWRLTGSRRGGVLGSWRSPRWWAGRRGRARCCRCCGNGLGAWPRRCCCIWPLTARDRWPARLRARTAREQAVLRAFLAITGSEVTVSFLALVVPRRI
jgi:CheY-like chemotaxis protein